MSARSESLASKVEQANNALLTATEGTSADQWRANCAEGDWTQGFAAYHAAASIASISGIVQAIANGEKLPPMTMADIDQNNSGQVKEHANRTREEALGLIRTNAPAATQMVRGFSDEQLDRKASLLIGMPEMSVAEVIEMLLVGHPTGHIQSMRGGS